MEASMNRFSYVSADGLADVAQAASAERSLARGDRQGDGQRDESNLGPERRIGLSREPLALDKIEDLEGGGLRLGAFVTNADIAYDPRASRRYPLLVSAILADASPLLRNVATSGGNLSHRTRCYYFYEPAGDCSEPEPGTAGGNGGVKCIHEILGASGIATGTHLSDMGVALTALDAKVRITGPGGERIVPFTEYCRSTEGHPWLDNCLNPGELMIAVELPPEDFSQHYAYSKSHDSGSSNNVRITVAVALRLEGDRISEARLALGGFAHSPWRSPIAESGLAGERVSRSTFAAAAHDILSGAVGEGDDDSKIEVASGAIVRALEQAVTTL
jgi:xanthine dehydrogenase YagS FAD-binding subunit